MHSNQVGFQHIVFLAIETILHDTAMIGENLEPEKALITKTNL